MGLKKGEKDSGGMGFCYIVQPGKLNWPRKTLRDSEQQTTIFKLSYVQTMLYKTCTVGFLNDFLMRRSESAFES